jgi:hypothetical protein
MSSTLGQFQTTGGSRESRELIPTTEPRFSKRIARKLLLSLFTIGIFAKLFLIPAILPPYPKTNWPFLYNLFNVPAFSYPGADARNIQVDAYCAKSRDTPITDKMLALTLPRPPRLFTRKHMRRFSTIR